MNVSAADPLTIISRHTRIYINIVIISFIHYYYYYILLYDDTRKYFPIFLYMYHRSTLILSQSFRMAVVILSISVCVYIKFGLC